MAKKSRRGQKQCPKCKVWIKGTRAKSCKCGHNFTNGKKKAVAKAAPAAVVAVEAAAKPVNTVTLEQIKAVSMMVKTIGGFARVHEMLGVIKEVGGVKKLKDLLDAMSAGEVSEGVPF